MIKMRCIRPHSSVVWGNVIEGETFEVLPGYASQLEDAGLASRVVVVEDVVVKVDTPVVTTEYKPENMSPVVQPKRRGRPRSGK